MKQSLWLADKQSFSSSTLTQSMHCDICIVGGGLSGIYSAYVLAQQGFSVVLVEALPHIAHGTTAYSTGKLTVQHERIYSKLSLADAQTYYKANAQAIEQVASLYPTGLTPVTSYLYTATAQGKAQLQQEAHRYKQLGIPFHATKETELALPVELALGIKQEAQIQPVACTYYFAHLAQKNGAQLYTNTRITKIDTKKRAVHTENNNTIHYKKLILCTHYPIEAFKNLAMLKIQVSRSYLAASVCTELLQGQYLSIDTPGRTIRTALIDETPYFIYGGFSHLAATRTSAHYYEMLQHELAAEFELPAPSYMWDAQDMMTFDQVPYIGQLSASDDSLFVATGFNKWGLSSSFVAGTLLSNVIQGQPHEAQALFSPNRSRFGKMLYYMLQTGGFVAKEFVKGYATRTNSPRCTHLGCKTKWNEADNTWDCPCHGSRYNKDGQVIEGPAVYPLNVKKSGNP